MKNLFLLTALMCIMAFSANAQLGAPTTKVKDTFDIVSVTYNGTHLNRADWPATIIVMDANNFYIAKHVYKIRPESALSKMEKREKKDVWISGLQPYNSDGTNYSISRTLYFTTCNRKKVKILTEYWYDGDIFFYIGEDYEFKVKRRTHHL